MAVTEDNSAPLNTSSDLVVRPSDNPSEEDTEQDTTDNNCPEEDRLADSKERTAAAAGTGTGLEGVTPASRVVAAAEQD